MKMPKLPRRGGKIRRQIAAFSGLDRTEAAEEGALRDSAGLSTRAWPCLAVRESLVPVDGYTAPTDVFSWDGHLVVVDGSVLYCDGAPLANVLPGKKQFAVVNTKLCVWPDKTYIDLTNGTYGHLDEQTVTAGAAGSVTVTGNTLRADLDPKFAAGLEFHYHVDTTKNDPSVRVYGADRDALLACWQNGAWDAAALTALNPSVKSFFAAEAADRPGVGDLFLPMRQSNSYTPVTGDAKTGDPPGADTDNGGYFAVITSVTGPSGSHSWKDARFTCDVYRAGAAGGKFSDRFRVGDRISVTGTKYGLADAELAPIRSMDDGTNTLTFPDGTFCHACGDDSLPPPAWMYEKAAELEPGGSGYLARIRPVEISYDYSFLLEEKPPEGTVLCLSGSGTDETLFLWDPAARAILWRKAVHRASASGGGAKAFSAYDPGLEQTLTVRRPVPDFDFICESGNRLWGVTNGGGARTIYASALGDPTAFWSFDGVSTDSWQAAVGSQGDFTAVVSYAGSVCCFKEGMLHKVSGDYPAEFYMSDYPMPGVRAGGSRTVQTVGGTIFYLGRDGAYAYGGSMPTRVSGRLGALELQDAVGGTDGRRWWLGGSEGGRGSLLCLDPERGVWLREGGELPAAFARTEDGLCVLTDGALWRMGSETGRDEAWMAQFAPWEAPFSKTGYTRLLLRLDMAPGSFAAAEIREDRGLWRSVWTQRADRQFTHEIPLRIGRCSRFELRLHGAGDVVIRGILREFTEGSDHGKTD